MSKPVIKRYFSEDIFKSIKADFKFLIDKITRSEFEYDLQIRDNYFNLYYKGNNLGKVSYKKTRQLYEIEIHNKFIDEKIRKKFKPRSRKRPDYLIFSLSRERLHSLFSSANLLSMGHGVKKVNYQEERILEQVLMTDNVNRSDLIIIDRQVVDTIDQTKMDMLALIQRKGNDYQFCVIEVKLGNNDDLRGKVVKQLKDYIGKIKDNFRDYKKCYEKNFKQKQELGLIDKNLKVNIVEGVSGMVAVVGYSGIAEKRIRELKQKAPDIRILHLKNIIDLSKAI